MTEQKKDPQLQLYTNVPVVLKLKKFVKEGESKHGKWYLWGVIKDQTDYVFFPHEVTHKQFLEKGEGATVQVVKKETEEGIRFEVNEADNDVRAGQVEREFLFNDKQNALCIMTQAIFKTIYIDAQGVSENIDMAYKGAKYLRDLILNDDQ